MHPHIYTHTHTHTKQNNNTQTHTHTNTRTHTHTQTHTHTNTFTHTHTHTHTHMHTHTRIHTHTHTHTKEGEKNHVCTLVGTCKVFLLWTQVITTTRPWWQCRPCTTVVASCVTMTTALGPGKRYLSSKAFVASQLQGYLKQSSVFVFLFLLIVLLVVLCSMKKTTKTKSFYHEKCLFGSLCLLSVLGVFVRLFMIVFRPDALLDEELMVTMSGSLGKSVVATKRMTFYGWWLLPLSWHLTPDGCYQ